MSSSPQAFSVQTMTRVVRPGDKVTLSCSIQHQNQTVWYGQQSNKLPFIIIISARKHHLRLKEVLNKFYKGNNYGFTTMFENNNSIILTICNMTGSLLALYYCTSGVGEETVFGLGHVLAYKNASVASKCDDGNNELERRKIDQGRNNDVQGGEEGVLYSALHFSNGDRRSKGKNTHN
ncbi:uncharacterized protein LOC123491662 isoform X2 [Coregonus clupeaformis]|uniref:uncharacterized protein LOC123491662 isoform X2 n=1 Tax=Coregonus clupeaformis TaxID=59861 RepID=UPI001E1C87A6|nr:uncharacterized protein LOC123491662 isoform X2 [Coregonus clupeaformis]